MTKRTLQDAVDDLANAAGTAKDQAEAAKKAEDARRAAAYDAYERAIEAARLVFETKFNVIKSGLAKRGIEANISQLPAVKYKFIDGLTRPNTTGEGGHILSISFKTGSRAKDSRDQYSEFAIEAEAVIRVLRITSWEANEYPPPNPVLAVVAAAHQSGNLYKFIALAATSIRDDNEDLDAALARAVDEVRPRG